MSTDIEHGKADSNRQGLGFLVWVLAGGVCAVLIGLILAHGSGLGAAVGIGILIFLASFGAGSFLGFLFGVPRVLSRDSTSGTAAQSSEAGGSTLPTPTTSARSTSSARLLQSNTNLERISDWLTTMLVGAGLVELHRINDGLVMFRDFLTEAARVFPSGTGHGLPTAGTIPVVGPVILVFGVASGFLYMYLSTRLVLIRLFQEIERLLAGEELLPPNSQRAVRAVKAGTDGASSFVGMQLASGGGTTIDDALNVMFDMLYKSDPQRVIDLGAQLSGTEATKRADYWFYLAAAFGQLLHRMARGEQEWNSARDNALDCARRAVAIDPAYRNRLWSISEPNSSDDDLAPLRDDPEFRRIVGRT